MRCQGLWFPLMEWSAATRWNHSATATTRVSLDDREWQTTTGPHESSFPFYISNRPRTYQMWAELTSHCCGGVKYTTPHIHFRRNGPPPSRPFSNLVDHLGDDRNCDNKYIEFSWRTWKGEIHEKGEEPRFSIPFPGKEKNTKKNDAAEAAAVQPIESSNHSLFLFRLWIAMAKGEKRCYLCGVLSRSFFFLSDNGRSVYVFQKQRSDSGKNAAAESKKAWSNGRYRLASVCVCLRLCSTQLNPNATTGRTAPFGEKKKKKEITLYFSVSSKHWIEPWHVGAWSRNIKVCAALTRRNVSPVQLVSSSSKKKTEKKIMHVV